MKRLTKLSKKQIEWIKITAINKQVELLWLKLIKEGKLTVCKAQTKKEMLEWGVDFNYPYKFVRTRH